MLLILLLMFLYGESYQGILIMKGKALSTVDLLVLTSSDQVLLILNIYFTSFAQTSYLYEEVNCSEPSLSAMVRWPHEQAFSDGFWWQHSGRTLAS